MLDDWEITTPELKAAWQQGRKELFIRTAKRTIHHWVNRIRAALRSMWTLPEDIVSAWPLSDEQGLKMHGIGQGGAHKTAAAGMEEMKKLTSHWVHLWPPQRVT